RTATGAETGDRGDRGHAAALDGIEDAIHLALVGDAVLATLELLELGDVGAGGKGLVAGAGDHQRLDLAGLGHSAADLGHALVHGESERIACLRAVEGDPADVAALVVEQFLGHFTLPSWWLA